MSNKVAAEAVNAESVPRPESMKTVADQTIPRPNPTQYVGTPAVGTSKAAEAAGIASVGPANTVVDRRRRRFVWSCVVAFLGVVHRLLSIFFTSRPV